MRAVRAMLCDWAFWLYLGVMFLTLVCLGFLWRQNRELMNTHRMSQRILAAILRRNAIADQEHRLIENQIQELERLKDARDMTETTR
jgi:hypothetical protein